MLNIIIFGPPGAGKGTQATAMVEKYNLHHISTGALLRKEIAAGTDLGVLAKSLIEKGCLVPDEVVEKMIENEFNTVTGVDGFLLDGFPRTIPQAEALDAMGVIPSVVLSLEVSDETIVERMSGRRVCAKCGASYHICFNPSKDGDKCDKCGCVLSIRRDDAPEVVQSRLTVYHETTEPLKEYYGQKGILKLVEGQERVEDTTALTLAALGI